MPPNRPARAVRFGVAAWLALASASAARPPEDRGPVRLAPRPVVSEPRFEPEGLPVTMEGDEPPLAMLTVGGGPTWTSCASYAPDGLTVAVGDRPNRPICTFLGDSPVNPNGGLIRVVDVGSRRVVRTFQPDKQAGHEYEVLALAHAPDGRTLVEVGEESWPKPGGGREYGYHATTRDAATGRPLRRVDSAKLDDSKSPIVSKDATTLAALTSAGPRAWDLAAGREYPAPAGAGRVVDAVLALSPDGKVLASGGEDGEVGAWEVATGRRIARVAAHRRVDRIFQVQSLAFTPNGRSLAVVGLAAVEVNPPYWEHTSELRLIDLATLGERAPIPVVGGQSIQSLAFSTDGRSIATVASDSSKCDDLAGVLTIRDLPSGNVRASVARTRSAHHLAYSPDGSALIQANAGWITIRDPADGRERFSIQQGAYTTAGVVLALAPDGRTLATSDGRFLISDLSAAAEPPVVGGHRFGIAALAYAPDGRTVASASLDGTVKLWDLAAKAPRATLLGHRSEVSRVAFSPDGRLVGSVDATGQVRIWDAATGSCRATLEGPEGTPRLLAFGPESATLDLFLWGYRQPSHHRRWDTATGAALPAAGLGADDPMPAAGSADGRLVAAADARRIEVRDLGTGALRSTLACAEEPLGLIVANGGDTILQKSPKSSIVAHRRVDGAWKSETLFERDDLGIQSGLGIAGESLTATPDGRSLAAVIEAAVLVFDTATGRTIAELPEPERSVTSLAFAPDGRSLATGHEDGEIQVHALDRPSPR